MNSRAVLQRTTLRKLQGELRSVERLWAGVSRLNVHHQPVDTTVVFRATKVICHPLAE
jgi:hypothetical protein